jgi:hypothetical protein
LSGESSTIKTRSKMLVEDIDYGNENLIEINEAILYLVKNI